MNVFVDYWGLVPYEPAANLMPIAGVGFGIIGVANLFQGNMAGWIQVLVGAALMGAGALLGSL